LIEELPCNGRYLAVHYSNLTLPSSGFFRRLSYAFGMGGLEKTAYDSKEKILYGVSEQGIVSILPSACSFCSSFNDDEAVINSHHYDVPSRSP
jgi:hypothetical protein